MSIISKDEESSREETKYKVVIKVDGEESYIVSNLNKADASKMAARRFDDKDDNEEVYLLRDTKVRGC